MRYWFSDVYFVCRREMKRFFSQKRRWLMSLVQPLVWLVFMGNVMSGMTGGPRGATLIQADRYLDFMTPGIMIMNAMFTGIFCGFSLVWDRHTGFLGKMLVSPMYRSAIPTGKMVAVALQVMVQVLVIAGVALVLKVRFATGLGGLVVVLLIAGLFGAAMAGASLAVSVLFKSLEGLHPILNLLTMPLIFTSNAIFPTAAMPRWMQVIAAWNPLSHAVAPMRTLIVEGWARDKVVHGLVVTLAFTVFMAVVAGVQFRRSLE